MAKSKEHPVKAQLHSLHSKSLQHHLQEWMALLGGTLPLQPSYPLGDAVSTILSKTSLYATFLQ